MRSTRGQYSEREDAAPRKSFPEALLQGRVQRPVAFLLQSLVLWQRNPARRASQVYARRKERVRFTFARVARTDAR